MLARDQLRQVLRLLLRGAVQLDLVDAEVRMRPVAEADRGGGPRHLLHRHAMGEVAHAEPAVFLGHGDSQQADLAHLRPQLHREGVGAVDLGGQRLHLLLRPAMGRVADRLDVLAERESQGGVEHGASSLGRFRGRGGCPALRGPSGSRRAGTRKGRLAGAPARERAPDRIRGPRGGGGEGAPRGVSWPQRPVRSRVICTRRLRGSSAAASGAGSVSALPVTRAMRSASMPASASARRETWARSVDSSQLP